MTIPIYNIPLHYFNSEKKYLKFLKKNFNYTDILEAYHLGRALHLQNDETQESAFVVFVREKDDLSTLHHEVNHITLFIFDMYNLNPFDSNGEHFCYMHDAIIEEILHGH